MQSQNSPSSADAIQLDDSLDIRERGAPTTDGKPQFSSRRLFLQLQVYTACSQPEKLIEPLNASGLDAVLYHDLNDSDGIGLLFLTEDPADLVTKARELRTSQAFAALRQKPELTMIGRTYSTGREPDLEDWLLVKPRRYALNSEFSWAVWYPLRRKPEFYQLPRSDQGKILGEHAMAGRAYVGAGYAHDVRLACFGLDQNDNDFVIGLLGAELYPLSRLVQEMRKTQQTAKYLESLGPFFVGKICWQSALR